MTEIVRELHVFWTDGRPVERLAYRVGAVLLLSGLSRGWIRRCARASGSAWARCSPG